MRIDSALYYILKDHLGSASVVTDASGNVVGEQRYYPFGETRLSTGTIYTDKLFTGQREITGLGIYHYGARFYSSKLGRFLSADTIVPGYANPQNLNRYSYVGNSPLNCTDPSGHLLCQFCDGEGGNLPPPSPTLPPPSPSPYPTPSPTPSPLPSPTPTPSPTPSPYPTPSPSTTPSPTTSPPLSTGTSPLFTQASSTEPNWKKIGAGVGLLVVALAADALIIYTAPALFEVWEVTMVVDTVKYLDIYHTPALPLNIIPRPPR